MIQVRLEEILCLLNEVQPLGKWSANTPLFESGYMDSMMIFDRLLPELEKTYEIEIVPWELIPENFDTPDAIYRYVKGKKKT